MPYLKMLQALLQLLSDLPEPGYQGLVSEVLSDKHQLNVRQINALAERFGVSAGVFL